MNVYVRYFDHENVFASGEEVVDFLVNLNDFNMTRQLQDEIINYTQGSMPYPKRIKVRNNVYFILIKTTAADLPDFKAHRKDPQSAAANENSRKDQRAEELRVENIGWYKGSITFRRVVLIPGTQKCSYRDTRFSAYVHANSGLDCYNQIIEHLRNRQDIDPRSQFPSEKKSNYSYTFLGQDAPIQ